MEVKDTDGTAYSGSSIHIRVLRKRAKLKIKISQLLSLHGQEI